MVQSRKLELQNLEFDPLYKQHCYCTLLAQNARSYTLEENIRSVQLLSLFVVFPSEVLNKSIKNCFVRVVRDSYEFLLWFLWGFYP